MSAEYVVAKVGDLPEGSHKLVEAGRHRLGLFNVHGKYYTLPNACLHQNGPLCLGVVTGTLEASAETNWERSWVRDGESIVCPWHTLEYDIATGRCLSNPRRRLATYQVEVSGQEIKVIVP
jgi:nitrite reductase/ring-hydroxylating ferredoxin subunit